MCICCFYNYKKIIIIIMTSTLLHSMLRIAGNGSNMSMGGLMRATQSVSMRSLTTTCMSIDAAKALSVSAAATASRKSDSKIILKNSLQKRGINIYRRTNDNISVTNFM